MQAQFEIAQSKVGTVMGKGGATVNAIKAYSKAQCFIEQHSPDEDKARVYVVGSATEIEKCKQTVLAVVDGTMSLATLCSLAGVPMPSGGRDDREASPPRAAPAHHGNAHYAHFAGAQAAAAGMAQSGPSAGLGPLGAAASMGAVGVVGQVGVPGMPQNEQMQQNLNDYYARWWSTYANMQQQEKMKHTQGNAKQPQEDSEAFDKERLLLLAQKAGQEDDEEPPPPPPDASWHQWPPPASQSTGGFDAATQPHQVMSEADLADRSSAEVRALLGGAMPSTTPPGGMPEAAMAGRAVPESFKQGFSQPVTLPPRKVPDVTLKGFLRPTPAREAPRPKKDDDSVQKMLERLQGNVEQTKQAVSLGEEQMRLRAAQMRATGQAFAWEPMNADPRSQADFEFEALTQRAQAAQSFDDLEHVAREVLIRFQTFTPQQAVDLMQKLDSGTSLQSHQNGDFLAEIGRLVIPRLKEFTSAQFTALTSTFASWSSEARVSKRMRGGRFFELSKAFFMAASAEMSSRLMTFAPHELNCCLAAFVSVGFSEHKFFASVGRAALARHSSFAPVQLTALLAILSEMRLVHHDLFNAAATFLSQRTKELRPVDIIRVLRSFAKCSVQHQGLCRSVGDEVVSRANERGALATFKVEELCEISWALCVLQHYHEDLFRIMFSALAQCPMITTDALLQVYECHLVMDVEHRDLYARYRIDPETLQILHEHYKENRKDERRCSERQRNDVASVLKSLVEGSVHVNHRTSTGLLVDVAALRKRSATDGFVHVDLDSAVTVVRSLDQEETSATALVTEGPVALRRRILQQSGLRLVTVRESDWRDLDDSRDKRRYLRTLLSSLGDVLE